MMSQATHCYAHEQGSSIESARIHRPIGALLRVWGSGVGLCHRSIPFRVSPFHSDVIVRGPRQQRASRVQRTV